MSRSRKDLVAPDDNDDVLGEHRRCRRRVRRSWPWSRRMRRMLILLLRIDRGILVEASNSP